MSVRDIVAAIKQLPATDVAALYAWLDEYHARLWDDQIEQDLESGRLDSILAEAEAEYAARQAQPL